MTMSFEDSPLNIEETLVACFNEEELRALCGELAIAYDALEGGDKAQKITSLVSLLERSQRTADLLALVQRYQPDVDRTRAAVPVANPYVGPRTFEEKDNRYFFGREREARTLLSLVISEPLVLFYAQSGAGKSSLINTRLIPGLRAHEFTVLPIGRVRGTPPEGVEAIDNIFVFNLLLSIDQGRHAPGDLARMTLTEYLQAQPLVSHETGAADLASNSGRVLIIDQFEEIISTNLAHWQQRRPFFQQLGQAIRDDLLLWVVLVMRDDYVAALDPYLPFLPNRLQARFYMLRMGIPAAKEAIEKPAREAGRSYGPGVAMALIDNLRQLRTENRLDTDRALGQFVEPVQLQVVCYQLWQQLEDRPDGTITMEDVQKLGDVDRALAQFYEQAIADVLRETGSSEIHLRNWFERHLITEAETRGTVYQGVKETAGLDNRVVQKLADRFLLRGEMRAGAMWYELIHDRFVAPILQANQAWRLRQSPLIRAAEAWDKAARPQDKLLRGQQLEEALATTDLDAVEPIVVEFLEASQDAQSQRNLEEARTRAEVEALRARQEAATAARLRKLTIVLLAAIVFAIVATSVAINRAGEASVNRRAAEAESTRAVEQRMIADSASTRAVEQRMSADRDSTRAIEQAAEARAASNLAVIEQATADAASTYAAQEQATANAASTRAGSEQATAIAESTRAVELRLAAENARVEAEKQRELLIVQSLAFMARDEATLDYDKELAMLLVLEARTINEREAGDLDALLDEALLSTVYVPYFNVTLTGHEGAVHAVAFSPDGRTLASAGADGTVRLWDLMDPAATPTLLDGHDGAVRAVAFLDNTVVSAGEDGAIHFWSIDDPGEPRRTLEEEVAIHFIDLALDGEALLVSLEDGTIHYWDLTGEDTGPELVSDWSEPVLRPVVFDRHDDTITSGNPDGSLYTSPRFSVSLYNYHFWRSSSISAIVAYHNGRVSATVDGNVRIERLEGLDFEFVAHDEPINSVGVSPTGETIASASNDGTVRLWAMPDRDASTAEPRATLHGHEGAVLSVAFARTVPAGGWAMASAGADGTIRLWRLEPPVTELEGGAPIAFSSERQLLASVLNEQNGTPQGTVQLRAIDGLGGQADSRSEPNGPISHIAFSPDGQFLVAGSNRDGFDGYIRVWQLDNSSSRQRQYLNYPVRALAISHDSMLVATAGQANGAIDVRPLENVTNPQVLVLRAHRSAVTHLAFTSDGKYLVSASSGGDAAAIHLWPVAPLREGQIPSPIALSQSGTQALSLTPDGHTLAVVQNGIRLWSLDDLEAAPVPLANSTANFNALAFSPDGQTLVAVGNDIRLWRLDDLNALPVTYSAIPLNYRAVAFAPDGKHFAVATENTTMLWPAPQRLAEEACRHIRRNLTWDEWQRYLPDEPYRTTCPNLPADPTAGEETGGEIGAKTTADTGERSVSRFYAIYLVIVLPAAWHRYLRKSRI